MKRWIQRAAVAVTVLGALSACGGGSDPDSSGSPVVTTVSDWATHQGTAGHRGHVPMRLDASRFALAWQWQREPATEPIGGINAVVTSAGKVFVSRDVYFGEGVLYALDELSGAESWRINFGQVPALGPPAVSQGRVFVPTTGHEQTALWAFDAATGQYLFKAPFEGQWPHAMAPTVHRSQVYVGAGYYGGTTYAFGASSGSRLWAADTQGVWDLFTPAVDDNHVYHHNGSALFVLDPVTGRTTASISDPFGNTDYAYHAAPMLGTRNNVIAFSGGAFSGRASSNVEPYAPRVLTSFDIAGRRIAWTSQHSYMTAPALAGGVVYAGSNQSPALHALDEATGRLLWQWTVPGNLANESFHRNVIVTDNLLFASTSTAVYAIDLATRQPVWSYPKPGMLALSADATLYIATGAIESDGGLVAIRLK